MAINDSNKTDLFDNEQAQLVHNDVAYQAATETTVNEINTKVNTTTATPAIASSGIIVRTIPFEPETYSAASSGFVSAALATDLFNIVGSGTKTIRVTRLIVSGTTTSGSPITVSASLIKRSTLNTGGTRVVASNVSHDSTNAAATASVGHYTTNPTILGTSVGNSRSQRITFNSTGITGGSVIWEFIDGQPITLRGTTQQLAINFNATTVTGSLVSISVEWQEI
jgi:hypothetical protein